MALTVQLEYLIIKWVKNGSNSADYSIGQWVIRVSVVDLVAMLFVIVTN